MHPRSRQWHLLDYVLAQRQDQQDVMVTKIILDADRWSDHRLVISEMWIHLQPHRRPQATARQPLPLPLTRTPPWKTDGVSCGTQSSRRCRPSSIAHAANTRTGLMTTSPSTTCTPIRTDCTKPTLTARPTTTKQPSTVVAALCNSGAWTARKIKELHGYADRNEWENFFATIKAGYCQTTKAIVLFSSTTGPPHALRRHKFYNDALSTSETSSTTPPPSPTPPSPVCLKWIPTPTSTPRPLSMKL
ncbi:hypothetical protein SprV_0802521700 [Sparganum proliferum]